jgi:DNA-binding response OmpR family regulator
MKRIVLVAEGDTELCDVYRTFLTGRGHEVETATDGLDCLEKLRRLNPAVLVLDLDLRWGGGDGVLAWLRERPSPWLPVVLTATAGCPDGVAKFLEPPVVDYLPKPFTLKALLASVRSALAGGQEAARKASDASAFPEMFIG